MEKKNQQQPQKVTVSSVKVLYLFLWHSILLLVLNNWVLVPLSLHKVGILGYVGKDAAPLWESLGKSCLEVFFPCFPWSYGSSVTSGSCEVSHQTNVSSIGFLLSTGQVAIGTCGSSLPVCARWSNLLLFSLGGSCIALQLHLWLVWGEMTGGFYQSRCLLGLGSSWWGVGRLSTD
jgi:hypothetical protein